MPGPPLTVETLHTILTRLLTANGFFQYDAQTIADRLLDAELRGRPDFGAALALRILTAVDHGDCDPRGRLLSLHTTATITAYDGSRAAGPVAATKAMQEAIQKARTAGGIAAVTVKNSQTLGAAGPYAELAAREGLIGLCITNTGSASVIAPHGQAAAVGNNAFAWAIPVQNSAPFVLDSACGACSWSTIARHRADGTPLAPGTAVDAKGNPTVNALEAAWLLPFGDAKGFGLAFLCGILAGPLAGGKTPRHKTRSDSADSSEHFCLVIDPAPFTDLNKFDQELRLTIDEIHNLPNSTGSTRLPGDRAAESCKQLRQSGITLRESVAEQLKARAVKKKIDVGW